MKMKCLRVSSLLMAAAGLTFASGCVVDQYGRVMVPAPVVFAPAPPAVIMTAPEPAVEVGFGVPDVYVEVPGIGFVGEVGDSYYYLDGGRWVICDSVRLGRFHEWERVGHGDWRSHAIRNDRFRTDSRGRRVSPVMASPRAATRGKPCRRKISPANSIDLGLNLELTHKIQSLTVFQVARQGRRFFY